MEQDRIPMTPTQLKMLPYIESVWVSKGKWPELSDLRTRYGKTVNLREDFKNPTFVLALNKRGIDLPRDEGLPADLTAEQVAAIAVFCDYNDHRSTASKLRKLGITTQQWYGWLKNPVFKKFLHQSSSMDFKDATHVAEQGLIKSIEKGDVTAIKYYNEINGIYTQEAASTVNMRVVVAQIIESIQRHVHDESTMRLIAADFDVILGGGHPDSRQIMPVIGI